MASASGGEVSMEADRQAQEDELELLQAMSKEGEFSWEKEGEGNVCGTLNVFLQLDSPIPVSVVHRSRTLHRQPRPSTHLASARSPQPKATPHPPPAIPTVLHLPPISLQFLLPPAYPSVSPPSFTLSCKWLSFSQLSILCSELDRIWQQDPGSVVLYNWQQFLSNNSLLCLGLSESLPLEFEDPIAATPTWDPRAVQDMPHPAFILPDLVEYDRKQHEELFASSVFDCEICFLSLPGSKCVKSGGCGHVHCRECLAAHVTAKVDSGDVTKLDCPSTDCEEVLAPHIVRGLVSKDIFQRYDELLLLRTLDKMGDMVYCPRPSCCCGTVHDDGSTMARCSLCMFSFCVLCRRAWHGISPCRLLPKDVKQLKETWEGLDDEARHDMETQFGKTQLQRAFQECESIEWLEGHAKQCPHCNSKIEKKEGCNKMTCSQCSGSFCWLCDAPLPKLNPYRHFQFGASSCAGRLFEGVEIGSDDDLD